MDALKKSELGWLAGIADGEGSFFLTATYDKQGRPCVKYAFTVGNTNLEILMELQRLYKLMLGKTFKLNPIKGRGNRKFSWNIQITSLPDLVVFCNAVEPYLVGKKAQANLMIEFAKIGFANGNQWSGPNRRVFEKRFEYVAKMKALNRFRTGAAENAMESQRETERQAPATGEETARPLRRRREVAETSTRLLPFTQKVS